MQFPSLPAFSELSFWWGIALAVPLSIIANLLTPLLLRTLGYFSSTLRERRERNEEAERSQAEHFAKSPDIYGTHQFAALLQFTIVGAFGGILTGVTASLAHVVYVVGAPDAIGQSLFLASQVFAVLVSLVVLTLAKRVWRTHRLVETARDKSQTGASAA